VSPHLTGTLVAVSPDLERGLYHVAHDNRAHERPSPKFAVVTHNGACVGLAFDTPVREWIPVAAERAN
jgi:hypothetical protein